MSLLLAVDGGNSKTDLALVRDDGVVLATARGVGSSPHRLGLDGALEVIDLLRVQALESARCDEPVEVAQLLLAGLDFPEEEAALAAAVEERSWAARVSVGNDTFAVLRAGTDRGWGVAVVCGAGINCVGVGPDGRHVRFPALGWITGDWGGGVDVGQRAVFAAARSEDGRGPRTTLEQVVPAHFRLDSPSALAKALHFRRIDEARAVELPPLVFAEALHDAVAAEIVDLLASEVVALAGAAIRRLGLENEAVEVLLGGGVLRSGHPRLTATIAAGLAEVGPAITARTTSAEPILGAALLGLDALDAPPEALERLRSELGPPVEAVAVGGDDRA